MYLLYIKYFYIYINISASYLYIVLPVRPYSTDLDCGDKPLKINLLETNP